MREEVFVDLIKRFASMEGSEINFLEMLSETTYVVIAMAAIRDVNKQYVAFVDKLDETLENVIRQHRIADSHNHEDLLDVLLKYHQDGLTIDNIKSVVLDLLAAGSDTSSTLVEWTMSELLKNPRILERTQQEFRKVFDEEGHVDESHIPQLKYLKSVVKETLRMHPPAPLLVPRLCEKTYN
ncbi:salviol synthase-like [Salvia miltiorrhiza]|uniref:salviol synthase-like n=1 Tax=Salvia miltiorrhiza TaxID=226208 RepID=UPI0025AD4CBB|nr:salviol synthase-like [Salvia miltiorrhiza]